MAKMSNFSIPLFLKIGTYSTITLKKTHKTFGRLSAESSIYSKTKKNQELFNLGVSLSNSRQLTYSSCQKLIKKMKEE